MNVNVAAMTARATPAWVARVDTAPTTSPPAELLLPDVDGLLVPLEAAGEPDEELDRLDVDGIDWVLNPVVLEVDSPVVEATMGVVAPVPDVDDSDEAEPVVLLLKERYDGAGTALDGSASAPVPQAIGCPLGWTEFGGGTVAPVESAMANRPVQVRFGAAGDVNW